MKYRLTKPTSRELAQIVDYILEDSPSSGGECADALEHAFASLCNNPSLGRPASDDGVRVLLLRKFRVRIFYEQWTNEVIILSLFHTSRDPDNLRI